MAKKKKKKKFFPTEGKHLIKANNYDFESYNKAAQTTNDILRQASTNDILTNLEKVHYLHGRWKGYEALDTRLNYSLPKSITNFLQKVLQKQEERERKIMAALGIKSTKTADFIKAIQSVSEGESRYAVVENLFAQEFYNEFIKGDGFDGVEVKMANVVERVNKQLLEVTDSPLLNKMKKNGGLTLELLNNFTKDIKKKNKFPSIEDTLEEYTYAQLYKALQPQQKGALSGALGEGGTGAIIAKTFDNLGVKNLKFKKTGQHRVKSASGKTKVEAKADILLTLGNEMNKIISGLSIKNYRKDTVGIASPSFQSIIDNLERYSIEGAAKAARTLNSDSFKTQLVNEMVNNRPAIYKDETSATQYLLELVRQTSFIWLGSGLFLNDKVSANDKKYFQNDFLITQNAVLPASAAIRAFSNNGKGANATPILNKEWSKKQLRQAKKMARTAEELGAFMFVTAQLDENYPVSKEDRLNAFYPMNVIKVGGSAGQQVLKNLKVKTSINALKSMEKLIGG